MAKTLYIIDGHAHIYAGYYAPMKPLTSPAGEPTKATYIFTKVMLGLIERNRPDMLVVTMDSKAPSFRKKIYPEYKAHRQPMPDDMPVQIARIEQILNAMNIPVLRLDGFEADDIIGTLAAQASAAGIETFICSKDKDMLQLLDKLTCTYDIKKDQRITPETMLADNGLTPDQFVDVLALQGDTADNVPGVPDVGPKTAMDWIQKYRSLDKLYEHADEIKGKRGQNLRNSKDLALLSKKLVTINCKVPVKLDAKTFAVTKPDEQALASIFTELGFSRLLTQLGLTPDETVLSKAEKEPMDLITSATGLQNIRSLPKKYHLIDTQKKFDSFLTKLKTRKIFALDTETTSIDAMRADLVGMSFAFKPHEAYYLPVKAPLGQKHLDIKMLRKNLGPILADEKPKKIGQNIKYDLLILHNAHLPVEGVFFDTMVASYCLAAERRSHSMDAMAKDFLNYEPIPISALIGKGKNQLTFDMVDTAAAADYAAEDADVTFLLYEYLSGELEKNPKIKKLFENLEMPLVTVLAKMELSGVSLDIKLLKTMSHTMTETIEKLTDEIHTLAGRVFNIASPKQLSEILFDHLGLRSVRSGKTSRSTDAGVLEQLQYQHEIIPLIIQYRQVDKLRNTYVDKLGQLINPRTDRVHASFNQTITATGRLSSSNPNLQNIPIRTDLGKKIRSAFVPANRSDLILSADYSQVELRLLAHFSKDRALSEAFTQDRDIHAFVASQVYGVALEDVDDEMRLRAKAVNFGIIYGQGPFGLSRSIGITQAAAKKFIDDYFARYSSIRNFMDGLIELAKKTGFAETIMGRRRKIENIDSKNHNKRAQAERFTINTVIQGSAADLIKIAMINIQRKIDSEKLPIKMILQIHDELVFELPETGSKKHAKWIANEMENAIKLDVPVKVDIAMGPTWLAE